MKKQTPTDRTSRLGGYVYSSVELYEPSLPEPTAAYFGLGRDGELPTWLIMPACPAWRVGYRCYPN